MREFLYNHKKIFNQISLKVNSKRKDKIIYKIIKKSRQYIYLLTALISFNNQHLLKSLLTLFFSFLEKLTLIVRQESFVQDLILLMFLLIKFDTLLLIHQSTILYKKITIFSRSKAVLVYLIWFIYYSSIYVFSSSTVSGIKPHKQLPHWIIRAMAIPNMRSYDYWFLNC